MKIWGVPALALALAAALLTGRDAPAQCKGKGKGGPMMTGQPGGKGRMMQSGPPMQMLSTTGGIGGLTTTVPQQNVLVTAQQRQMQLVRVLESLEGVVGDERLGKVGSRKLSVALVSARGKVQKAGDQLSGVEERQKLGLLTERDQMRLTALTMQQQQLLQALEPYRVGAAQAFLRAEKKGE